jgi:hypothetical protein
MTYNCPFCSPSDACRLQAIVGFLPNDTILQIDFKQVRMMASGSGPATPGHCCFALSFLSCVV